MKAHEFGAPGQGARLQQVLDLRYKTQAEAAELFGVQQSDISKWVRKQWMSAYWLLVHAPKLENAGLNPTYITDPSAPIEALQTA